MFLRNLRSPQIAATLVALFTCAAIVASACGPGFPTLLYDRKHTLSLRIGGDFKRDAIQFSAPPKFKFTVGTGSSKHPNDPEDARAEIEQRDLSPQQVKTLLAMRAAPDGDAAYAIGDDLPQAVRLYTAGAVDFHLGRVSRNWNCSFNPANLRCAAAQNADEATRKQARLRAETRFKSVLALPEAESRARATWATFMLGRVLSEDGRDDEARKAFRRTRELAERGFPDPLGLAEASLGEEAKGYFGAEDYSRAAALYAEQSALASASGADSLRMVAQNLLSAPAMLKSTITDPLVQKVVVSYVLDMNENSRGDFLDSDDADAQSQHPAALTTLANAIAGLSLEQLDQADRLAALAYNAGRYELAGRFVKRAHGPLAAWVEAKLAMRRGDSTAAAQHYAEAAKAFQQLGKGISANSSQPRHVMGERAVLLLARGEYAQALAQFYAVGAHYWPDLAYVAERVMTVDELKAFVDANVPKPPIPKVDRSGKIIDVQPEEYMEWPGFSPAAQLRDLLARRLVREGRFAEAGQYFHDAADARFAEQPLGSKKSRIPDARTATESYARALRAADRAWTSLGRARELFTAARLARIEGMSMMGYELAPDYFMGSGDHEFDTTAPDPKGRALVSKGEAKRYHASIAHPNKRFHYRHIAVDLALQAADILPHRSQAYAAVLCHATGWLVDRDNEKAEKIYRRYLKDGPHVPWASHFGRNCPEPEFGRAYAMAASDRIAPLTRPIKRHPRRTAAGVALVLVLAGGWYWRRRRTG